MMKKFKPIHSIAVPWLMPNVDTDTISPMKRLILNTEELGKYSFEPYRFVDGDGDKGILNMEFPLNMPRYKDAKILITGSNFGCGSSRETAPEAISQCGYECIFGSSFGGIFTKNCYQQGILPIVFPEKTIKRFAEQAEELGFFDVNLEDSFVRDPEGNFFAFQIEDEKKQMLLQGMDEIRKTLSKSDKLESFIEKDKCIRPWIYATEVE